VIALADIVRAAHLAPSVGPFTIRRLLFRASIFQPDAFERDEIVRALPIIEAELTEFLSAGDLMAAKRDLRGLLGLPNDNGVPQ
jgi:hypothetical protein